MSLELEAPQLVSAPVRDGATVTLRGGRCASCGFVAFPHYGYGCERCGASGLEPTELSGEGEILASIVVHRTRDRIRDGVATIALDEGPVIRAVLGSADPLAGPGTRVSARLRPLRHKAAVLGLRFERSA